jgi:hypothetical protein
MTVCSWLSEAQPAGSSGSFTGQALQQAHRAGLTHCLGSTKVLALDGREEGSLNKALVPA